MFHALGFTQMVLAITLGCTTIVERRFKPDRVLDAITERRPEVLVVVPVMLQRIVSLLEAEPGRWDTSSLRIIFSSGSAAGGRARAANPARRSATCSTTSTARPRSRGQRSRHPRTSARRPAPPVARRTGRSSGYTTRRGAACAGAGASGRIFVGNGYQFDGYTGGGGKEIIDGLMSSGDVGHFDSAGRLFVDGRDDDMIVSGGENIFPVEVEELLLSHPAVEEAAVIGVEDPEFGQRLAAFVVRKPGAELTDEAVRELVKRNLARYKVPRDVSFLDQLPRNPTGKVLKRELRLRAEPLHLSE